VGLGVIYLVAALVTGHSATSEPPPDLSAREAGLDVWRALTFLSESRTQVVDVRPKDDFRLYHVRHSRSLPGANVGDLSEVGRRVFLIAPSDEEAARICGELRSRGITAHYLKGGIQSWYLALELPVPLFNKDRPPRHYVESIAQIRHWLRSGQRDPELKKAIETLAGTSYLPSLKGRPTKSAAKKRKKISGGCG
jgi:rhodanese-related sulfurtransferase